MSLPRLPFLRRGLKIALILLLAVVWLPSASAQGKPKPLVVGMELSYPPFEMTDEQGKPTGIGVDLAEALAAKLGRPLEVRNYEFTGLIPALKTGQIDLVISSMTITTERKESIDFSSAYISTGLAMLVNKKSNLRSADDLDKPGRRVVVKKGTTGFDYVTKKLQQLQPLILEAEAACALEVIQGKADAFIYDRISVVQFNRRNPDTTSVIAMDKAEPEQWGIGLKKNNKLLAEVNAFLAEFKASKGLEKLLDKYITDPAGREALSVPGQ